MKKLFALAIVAGMAFASCGSNPATEPEAVEAEAIEEMVEDQNSEEVAEMAEEVVAEEAAE